MKKKPETHLALFFVLGTAALAALFLILAYILLFNTELVLVFLRYAAAAMSAVIGVALAVYAIKLIRRFLHM